MKLRPRSGGEHSERRGAATTELAVCLPVMMFVCMAGIQAANVIFLKQTLAIAGYETIREAVKPDSSLAQAEARGQQILTNRGVKGTSIVVSPDPGTVQLGQPVTAVVTAESHQNTPLSGWFFGNRLLATRTQMVKE